MASFQRILVASLLCLIPTTIAAQPLIDGVAGDRVGNVHADEADYYTPDADEVVWTSRLIERRGADYLRLRFSQVTSETAYEFTIRIVDPDEQELWTVPEAMFRDGADFWTPRLPSDTVQVLIHAPAKPQGLSFRISEIAFQREEADQPLGTFSIRPNYLYVNSETVGAELSRLARAVVKLDYLKAGRSESCTAFLIAPDRFITNDHCISSQQVCQTAWVTFDFLVSATGEESRGPRYPCNELLSADAPELSKLDTAIFSVKGDLQAEGRPYFEFSERPAESDRPFAILHHPRGNPMRISTKRCEVKTMQAPGRLGLPVDFGHQCDTNPGSSGAPILDLESCKVVGLHHLGFDDWGRYSRENRAVRVEHLIPHMMSADEASAEGDQLNLP